MCCMDRREYLKQARNAAIAGIGVGLAGCTGDGSDGLSNSDDDLDQDLVEISYDDLVDNVGEYVLGEDGDLELQGESDVPKHRITDSLDLNFQDTEPMAVSRVEGRGESIFGKNPGYIPADIYTATEPSSENSIEFLVDERSDIFDVEQPDNVGVAGYPVTVWDGEASANEQGSDPTDYAFLITDTYELD